MLTKVSARSVFQGSRRFDLPFKIALVEAWAKNIDDAWQSHAYLQSVKAFNRYFEEEPRKKSAEDFLNAFRALYKSISENGFIPTNEPIQVSKNGELLSGAHRLSICAYLNLTIPIRYVADEEVWDYKFFRRKGLKEIYLDYAASIVCETKLNSRILIVYGTVPKILRREIEKQLHEIAQIEYCKSIRFRLNELKNLKRFLYISENWIGTPENRFFGAFRHSLMSFSFRKSNIYVLTNIDSSNLTYFKKKFRQQIGQGNYPIHSTDNHAETVRISKILFHKDTRIILKSLSARWPNKEVLGKLSLLKNEINKHGRISPKFIITGSTILELLGLRPARDLDFLINPKMVDTTKTLNVLEIQSHTSQLNFYEHSLKEYFENPTLFFSIGDLFFLSPSQLLRMKIARKEFPKDYFDIYLLSMVTKPAPIKFFLLLLYPFFKIFFLFFSLTINVYQIFAFVLRKYLVSKALRLGKSSQKNR